MGTWNPTIWNPEAYEIWTFWRSDFKCMLTSLLTLVVGLLVLWCEEVFCLSEHFPKCQYSHGLTKMWPHWLQDKLMSGNLRPNEFFPRVIKHVERGFFFAPTPPPDLDFFAQPEWLIKKPKWLNTSKFWPNPLKHNCTEINSPHLFGYQRFRSRF